MPAASPGCPLPITGQATMTGRSALPSRSSPSPKVPGSAGSPGDGWGNPRVPRARLRTRVGAEACGSGPEPRPRHPVATNPSHRGPDGRDPDAYRDGTKPFSRRNPLPCNELRILLWAHRPDARRSRPRSIGRGGSERLPHRARCEARWRTERSEPISATQLLASATDSSMRPWRTGPIRVALDAVDRRPGGSSPPSSNAPRLDEDHDRCPRRSEPISATQLLTLMEILDLAPSAPTASGPRIGRATTGHGAGRWLGVGGPLVSPTSHETQRSRGNKPGEADSGRWAAGPRIGRGLPGARAPSRGDSRNELGPIGATHDLVRNIAESSGHTIGAPAGDWAAPSLVTGVRPEHPSPDRRVDAPGASVLAATRDKMG
jgi:hypothetical protein